MPLLTALEDLVQRSLSALPTVWEKLRFLADLRDSEGNYQHWGLEQKFGEAEAQAAMAEAHGQLACEFAATPLPQLWLAADQAARRNESRISDYFATLGLSGREFSSNLQGVAPEHLDFVIASLARVAHSRSASTQTAA